VNNPAWPQPNPIATYRFYSNAQKYLAQFEQRILEGATLHVGD